MGGRIWEGEELSFLTSFLFGLGHLYAKRPTLGCGPWLGRIPKIMHHVSSFRSALCPSLSPPPPLFLCTSFTHDLSLSRYLYTWGTCIWSHYPLHHSIITTFHFLESVTSPSPPFHFHPHFNFLQLLPTNLTPFPISQFFLIHNFLPSSFVLCLNLSISSTSCLAHRMPTHSINPTKINWSVRFL